MSNRPSVCSQKIKIKNFAPVFFSLILRHVTVKKLLDAPDAFQRFNEALHLHPPIFYADTYMHNITGVDNDKRIIEKLKTKSYVYFSTKNAIKGC
jgi:hypothetical protein